ncbi:MAG: hypothetical protein ACT4NX_08285 [Deltaproteobacteria bacterium]
MEKFKIANLAEALSSKTGFILDMEGNRRIALSWWVSPKRTRSYPYARVYNTLNFQGKRATIIPIIKDEGKKGDRDFLQWDTISLMSLLGIYLIISYYARAEPSQRYRNKITNQQFKLDQVRNEIHRLLSYQSDALHWNLSQAEKAGVLGREALDAYGEISSELGVEIHSRKSAENRVNEILKGRENFMSLSRTLAEKAQKREKLTVQPKEKLSGMKATLTIKNYLGGYYYLTCDEAYIENEKLYLTECKHSRREKLPSLEDIKDGLVKMILLTNLKVAVVGGREYTPLSALKLTSDVNFSPNSLAKYQISHLRTLQKEAEENGFEVLINDINLRLLQL